jgi:hypothetical protein
MEDINPIHVDTEIYRHGRAWIRILQELLPRMDKRKEKLQENSSYRRILSRSAVDDRGVGVHGECRVRGEDRTWS